MGLGPWCDRDHGNLHFLMLIRIAQILTTEQCMQRTSLARHIFAVPAPLLLGSSIGRQVVLIEQQVFRPFASQSTLPS